MRNTFQISAVVAVAALLSACNSTESLYASGPWWPGVAGPPPGYGGPLISPKAYDLDTAQDIRPGVYPRPVAPGQIVIDVPAAPPPAYEPSPYGSRGVGPLPPVAAAPLSDPGSVPMAGPSQHAALPPSPPPTGVTPSTRPSSFAGSWRAVDAQGVACKVQLSSSPALDLYRASTSGCANQKLATVNTWSVRDGKVILFSRGNVVARLSGPEASLAGTFTSGESLRMTR